MRQPYNGLLGNLADMYGIGMGQQQEQLANDYYRRQQENMQRWQNTARGKASTMVVQEPKKKYDLHDVVDADFELVSQKHKGLPQPK